MIIYKTTNLINNKIYVGQDSHNNPKYLGSGKALLNAIKKYGKENFIKEILEVCKTKNRLDCREKYWIKKLNSQNKKIGYNISDGGQGITTLNNPDKNYIRRKISRKAKIRFKNPNEREKIRQIKKLQWADPNSIYNSNEYRINHSNGNKRRFENINERKLASKRMKRRWEDISYQKEMSDMSKNRWKKQHEKMSLAIKAGWKNSDSKILISGINSNSWKGYVYVYNPKGKFVGRFDTIRQAAKKFNISIESMRKNVRKTYPLSKGNLKGYTFKISKNKNLK